jgi:hypothetical protein
LVPFASIGAVGVGIKTVATTTPIAAGVEMVATTTSRRAGVETVATTASRRASKKGSEKARKKRERQLDNIAEKEHNFKDIVEANIAFLKSQLGQNLHLMTTEPERKFAIVVNDDQKPGLSLGDYVRLAKDTSPGLNRLEGYGFVKKVRGVGASTIATVKYDEAFGGLLHSNIIFQDLTVALFGQDWECEDQEITQRKGK